MDFCNLCGGPESQGSLHCSDCPMVVHLQCLPPHLRPAVCASFKDWQCAACHRKRSLTGQQGGAEGKVGSETGGGRNGDVEGGSEEKVDSETGGNEKGHVEGGEKGELGLGTGGLRKTETDGGPRKRGMEASIDCPASHKKPKGVTDVPQSATKTRKGKSELRGVAGTELAGNPGPKRRAAGGGKEEKCFTEGPPIEQRTDIESDSDSGASVHPDAECDACEKNVDDALMLLCDTDGCEGRLHTYCCKPPLDAVPEGKWFCPDCKVPPGKKKQLQTAPQGKQGNGSAGQSEDVEGKNEKERWERLLQHPGKGRKVAGGVGATPEFTPVVNWIDDGVRCMQRGGAPGRWRQCTATRREGVADCDYHWALAARSNKRYCAKRKAQEESEHCSERNQVESKTPRKERFGKEERTGGSGKKRAKSGKGVRSDGFVDDGVRCTYYRSRTGGQVQNQCVRDRVEGRTRCSNHAFKTKTGRYGKASREEPDGAATGTVSESDADSAVDPDCKCDVCGSPDQDDVMMLCHNVRCDSVRHTFCCNPPLAAVPDGPWFCDNCANGLGPPPGDVSNSASGIRFVRWEGGKHGEGEGSGKTGPVCAKEGVVTDSASKRAKKPKLLEWPGEAAAVQKSGMGGLVGGQPGAAQKPRFSPVARRLDYGIRCGKMGGSAAVPMQCTATCLEGYKDCEYHRTLARNSAKRRLAEAIAGQSRGGSSGGSAGKKRQVSSGPKRVAQRKQLVWGAGSQLNKPVVSVVAKTVRDGSRCTKVGRQGDGLWQCTRAPQPEFRFCEYHRRLHVRTPADGATNEPEGPDSDVDSAVDPDCECDVCGSPDQDDVMLLCHDVRCDSVRHTFCCDPPLAAVPDGPWFCDKCANGLGPKGDVSKSASKCKLLTWQGGTKGKPKGSGKNGAVRGMAQSPRFCQVAKPIIGGARCHRVGGVGKGSYQCTGTHVAGSSLCEYHLMQRKGNEKRRFAAAIASTSRGDKLSTGGSAGKKRQELKGLGTSAQKKQLRKAAGLGAGLGAGLLGSKPGVSVVTRPVRDGSRCTKTGRQGDGLWQCTRAPQPGFRWCRHHRRTCRETEPAKRTAGLSPKPTVSAVEKVVRNGSRCRKAGRNGTKGLWQCTAAPEDGAKFCGYHKVQFQGVKKRGLGGGPTDRERPRQALSIEGSGSRFVIRRPVAGSGESAADREKPLQEGSDLGAKRPAKRSRGSADGNESDQEANVENEGGARTTAQEQAPSPGLQSPVAATQAAPATPSLRSLKRPSGAIETESNTAAGAESTGYSEPSRSPPSPKKAKMCEGGGSAVLVLATPQEEEVPGDVLQQGSASRSPAEGRGSPEGNAGGQQPEGSLGRHIEGSLGQIGGSVGLQSGGSLEQQIGGSLRQQIEDSLGQQIGGSLGQQVGGSPGQQLEAFLGNQFEAFLNKQFGESGPVNSFQAYIAQQVQQQLQLWAPRNVLALPEAPHWGDQTAGISHPPEGGQKPSAPGNENVLQRDGIKARRVGEGIQTEKGSSKDGIETAGDHTARGTDPLESGERMSALRNENGSRNEQNGARSGGNGNEMEAGMGEDGIEIAGGQTARVTDPLEGGGGEPAPRNENDLQRRGNEAKPVGDENETGEDGVTDLGPRESGVKVPASATGIGAGVESGSETKCPEQQIPPRGVPPPAPAIPPERFMSVCSCCSQKYTFPLHARDQCVRCQRCKEVFRATEIAPRVVNPLDKAPEQGEPRGPAAGENQGVNTDPVNTNRKLYFGGDVQRAESTQPEVRAAESLQDGQMSPPANTPLKGQAKPATGSGMATTAFTGLETKPGGPAVVVATAGQQDGLSGSPSKLGVTESDFVGRDVQNEQGRVVGVTERPEGATCRTEEGNDAQALAAMTAVEEARMEPCAAAPPTEAPGGVINYGVTGSVREAANQVGGKTVDEARMHTAEGGDTCHVSEQRSEGTSEGGHVGSEPSLPEERTEPWAAAPVTGAPAAVNYDGVTGSVTEAVKHVRGGIVDGAPVHTAARVDTWHAVEKRPDGIQAVGSVVPAPNSRVPLGIRESSGRHVASFPPDSTTEGFLDLGQSADDQKSKEKRTDPVATLPPSDGDANSTLVPPLSSEQLAPTQKLTPKSPPHTVHSSSTPPAESLPIPPVEGIPGEQVHLRAQYGTPAARTATAPAAKGLVRDLSPSGSGSAPGVESTETLHQADVPANAVKLLETPLKTIAARLGGNCETSVSAHPISNSTTTGVSLSEPEQGSTGPPTPATGPRPKPKGAIPDWKKAWQKPKLKW